MTMQLVHIYLPAELVDFAKQYAATHIGVKYQAYLRELLIIAVESEKTKGTQNEKLITKSATET